MAVALGLAAALSFLGSAQLGYVPFLAAAALTACTVGFLPALLVGVAGIPATMVFSSSAPQAPPEQAVMVLVYGAGMLAVAVLGGRTKRACERAQRAARFRQVVLDLLPQKIGVLDSSGRVIAANRRWRELDVGMDYLEFCRQAAASEEPTAVEAFHAVRAVLEGEKSETEHEYPCDTETEHQCFVMRVIRPPGDVGGAIVTHSDVTARQRAQEQLETTAEELRRSNEDLEKFASFASHDLRAPLGVINLYVSLLRKRYAHQLDPEADALLGHISDSVARMNDLIRDLLDFCRVGRNAGGPVDADMEEVLFEALGSLKSGIEERQARITHDALPTLRVERPLMRQLLQNLIGNAVKFCPDDKRPEIHVTASRNDGAWVFRIQDNGPGIPAEEQQRIFLPFQRAQGRSKTDGSGVGLAICQRIVEHHGGRIWVESRTEEGAAFFFTVPVSD